MLPEGWKIKSLGEVCDGKLQTGPFGSQLHAHEYVDDGVAVLMPKDLIGCQANIGSAAKITKARATDLKKHILEIGDLLFSRRGDVTRFALIDELSSGSLCGTGCLRARPSNAHSCNFLSYFLQKDTVKRWLEQNAVGQTMPNMNTSILFELPLISASSKEEEKKIAKIIFTWDMAIASTEKLISNSQKQKQALMQQLLSGKKRLNGFEEEWEKDVLGNLFSFSRGMGLSKTAVEKGGSNKCILYGEIYTKYSEVIGSVLSGTDSSDGVSSVAGDILMPSSTTTTGIDLANAVALLEDEVLLGGDIIILRPDRTKVCSVFFAHLLTHIKKHEIASYAQGVTIIHLYGKDLKPIEVSFPTLVEQQYISKVLNSSDQEIDVLQQKLNFLKQEKKALMQQLLTGKRRVKLND